MCKNHSSNVSQALVHYRICGKPTHILQKCWYRYNFARNEEEIPQPLVAMTINEVPDLNRYADIDAITLMINDPSNLVFCAFI